jgi:hypothetical protein
LELPPGSERQFDQRVAGSVREYAPAFEQYHITETPDRALRELLLLCRQEGIAAALFLMPEEARFHAAYSTEARFEVKAYLTTLQSEFRCTVIDVENHRLALDSSASNFADGHHLSAQGARRFSERFGAEFLAWSEARSGVERRAPLESREAREVAENRELSPSPRLR